MDDAVNDVSSKKKQRMGGDASSSNNITKQLYDVFIIHTSYEKRVEVSALKEKLEAVSLRCFVDNDDIEKHKPASPNDQMKQALEDCRYVVAIITNEFLERKDPMAELLFAFQRMEYIRRHYKWQSLWVIFLDIDLEEYKTFQKDHPTTIPQLWHDVQVTVFHRLGGGGVYKTWSLLCHGVAQQLLTTDKEYGAKNAWESFIKDRISRYRRKDYPSSAHLYRTPLGRNITNRDELLKLLPGTTWRKPDGLETVIFQDNGKFYNNRAGHPVWRENTYTCSSSESSDLSIILTWSIDGFEITAAFDPSFEFFQEGSFFWELVALRPQGYEP